MKLFIKKIGKYSFFYILIILIVLFVYLVSYLFKSNSTVNVYYSSNNYSKYNVYLKENEYFNDFYLPMNKQYIVKLIDYIDIKFGDDYHFSSSTTFESFVKVNSIVTIKNTNTEKDLYNLNELIYNDSNKYEKKENASVSHEFKIDYNRYNDLVKSIIHEYSLTSTKSTLEISAVVEINGDKKGLSKNFYDRLDIKYIIPLNEDTIDIKSNIESKNSDIDYYVVSKSGDNNTFVIICVIVDLIAIIFLIVKKYYNLLVKIKRKLFAKNNGEIDKIIKKYGLFINEVESFNFNSYEKIKLLHFESLLDIKDSTNNALFMKKDKNSVKFFVIQDNKVYIYNVKICK